MPVLKPAGGIGHSSFYGRSDPFLPTAQLFSLLLKNAHTMDTERGRSEEEDDIQDSPSDQERLRPEITTIDLPDVEDIPGQENIHVPPLGELADVTISSDDEEDILNGDTLEGDPDLDNDDTIGIP